MIECLARCRHRNLQRSLGVAWCSCRPCDAANLFAARVIEHDRARCGLPDYYRHQLSPRRFIAIACRAPARGAKRQFYPIGPGDIRFTVRFQRISSVFVCSSNSPKYETAIHRLLGRGNGSMKALCFARLALARKLVEEGCDPTTPFSVNGVTPARIDQAVSSEGPVRAALAQSTERNRRRAAAIMRLSLIHI